MVFCSLDPLKKSSKRKKPKKEGNSRGVTTSFNHYFYQLDQPKVLPTLQIINVGWSILGKNNITVKGRGEMTSFQYILHLIVSREGMPELKTHLVER